MAQNIYNQQIWKLKLRHKFSGLLSLVFVITLAGCSSGTHQIATPQDEIEANKIIGLLHQYKIKSDKQAVVKENTTTLIIVVAGNENDIQNAIQILNDYALPRQRKEKIDLSGQMPLTGVKEKLIKEQEAEEKIENIVLQYPGLVRAEVKVDLPDTGPKIEPVGPSLVVHATSVEDPPLVSEKQLRELLRTSVNELKDEHLAISITVQKPLIPMPQQQFGATSAGLNLPARNRLLGIAAGIIIVLGAIGGIWFMRRRRQEEWDDDLDEEAEVLTEGEVDATQRQLSIP